MPGNRDKHGRLHLSATRSKRTKTKRMRAKCMQVSGAATSNAPATFSEQPCILLPSESPPSQELKPADTSARLSNSHFTQDLHYLQHRAVNSNSTLHGDETDQRINSTHVAAMFNVADSSLPPPSATSKKRFFHVEKSISSLKKCVVPDCESNSKSCPNMNFVLLPTNNNLRLKWIRAITDSKQFYLPKAMNRFCYCCERHFNLKYDSLNYKKWTLGEEELKLHDGVLPRFNITPINKDVNIVQNKSCFVPGCFNTVQTCPGKLFIKVPSMKEIRTKWFMAVGRTDVDTSDLYCCMDHFDMNVDLYRKENSFLIKSNTVPHLNIKTNTGEENVKCNKVQNLNGHEDESENLDMLDEEMMSLKEIKDISTSKVVRVGNPTNCNNKDSMSLMDPLNKKSVISLDMKSKEMYLISLLPDLHEMSNSQIETFKTKIYETIRRIKARK